jgi:hypothetical protein
MIWMDYTVEQAGPHFRIKGDWEGEVMGIGRDGTPKESMLYKPGDVFVVNEHGWLMKKDELQVFLDKGKNK